MAASSRGKRPLVLFVGQDRQETPGRYLVRGLREEGWQVSCINSDEYALRADGTVGKLLQRATEPLSNRALANAIMKRARLIRPDYIVGIKSLPLTERQSADLRSEGMKLGVWYPDVSFEHGAAFDADMLSYLDFLATTKHYHLPFLAENYSDLKVVLSEHGYCDDVHYPAQTPTAPRFDLGYVGNHSPHKLTILSEIAEAKPGLKIGVVGNGWDRSSHWETFPALVGEEMGNFFGSTKIALAEHYGPHGAHGWQDTTSARTFEIPAIGAFMLHPENAEVKTYFDADREIGVYRDLGDLMVQIDRWLADDLGRRAAATRACRRARPSYSYSERGRQLARWLNKQVF